MIGLIGPDGPSGIRQVMRASRTGSAGASAAYNAAMGMATAASTIPTLATMQMQLDQITDYLSSIRENIDDILRAQKDLVVSNMVGAGIILDDALTEQRHAGHVSATTWAKIQGLPVSIASTQAYALRQLDAISGRMQAKGVHGDVGDMLRAATAAEPAVREWLAVTAKCVQMQDAFAMLELGYALKADPGEVESTRLAIADNRSKRLRLITDALCPWPPLLQDIAAKANRQVMLHPKKAPMIADTCGRIGQDLALFASRIGLPLDEQRIMTRRWNDILTDMGNNAMRMGTQGIEAIKNAGTGLVDGAGRLLGGGKDGKENPEGVETPRAPAKAEAGTPVGTPPPTMPGAIGNAHGGTAAAPSSWITPVTSATARAAAAASGGGSGQSIPPAQPQAPQGRPAPPPPVPRTGWDQPLPPSARS